MYCTHRYDPSEGNLASGIVNPFTPVERTEAYEAFVAEGGIFNSARDIPNVKLKKLHRIHRDQGLSPVSSLFKRKLHDDYPTKFIFIIF